MTAVAVESLSVRLVDAAPPVIDSLDLAVDDREIFGLVGVQSVRFIRRPAVPDP